MNLEKEDLKFIESIFGRDEAYTKKQIIGNQEVRDELLDREEIFHAVLESPEQVPVSLGLYFYVLIRKALLEGGVDDRLVVDYIVSILMKCLHVEGAFNNSASGGKTFLYIIDSLKKIEEVGSEERFYLRVNFANQVLFLTGLFEEYIRFRSKRRGGPDVEFFEIMGGAQYSLAQEHRLSNEYGLERVFEILGNEFSGVRKSLNRVRERFVHLGDPFL